MLVYLVDKRRRETQFIFQSHHILSLFYLRVSINLPLLLLCDTLWLGCFSVTPNKAKNIPDLRNKNASMLSLPASDGLQRIAERKLSSASSTLPSECSRRPLKNDETKLVKNFESRKLSLADNCRAQLLGCRSDSS